MNTNSWRLRKHKLVTPIKIALEPAQERADYLKRCLTNFARLWLQGDAPGRPAITGVLAGRNDDYMPDFRQRLHATIDWNTRYLLDEVIFVEWNPPPERPLLSTELAARFKSLRAYVVPPEIHRAVCRNPNLNLMEYHAKNAGIRRARTPWVVATNGDAAFGPDTAYNVTHDALAEDLVWVARRVDVDWRGAREMKVRALECLNYRRMLFDIPFGTGEFLLAGKQLWDRARGYDESLAKHRLGCDERGTAQMLAHGARLRKAGFIFHLDHPNSYRDERQPHHGEPVEVGSDLPYHNGDDWGLGDCREVALAERVWRLER
jgi:hypothetical protein